MRDTPFDEHAQAIAKRQYMQPGDGDIYGMFHRVAAWVATPEREDERERWTRAFEALMRSKRFCPGGRVLAGAATPHGNVLNCFVQGATDHPPESLEGIMEVAKKLALVTKVGGGNGVNLDPHRSSPEDRRWGMVRGFAYMRADHRDVEDFIKGLMRPSSNPDGEKVPHAVRNWTRVIYGQVSPELAAMAREYGVRTVRERPEAVIEIDDDMGSIMDVAAEAARLALLGKEPHIDFSRLRHEGAPVKSSGGTASGPTSYLVEIYDNFLEWANRGGPEAGPVATLRYVYAPVLRVVRQGGTRRGAGMATLDVGHPDLFDFLTAKDLDREAAEGDISTFNISVLVSNAFVKVLEEDGLWPIEPREVPGKYYPVRLEGPYQGRVPELPEREDGARPIPVFEGGVPARWIWHEIAWHAWATGEPGLIFIDRVNEKSALKGLGERWQIRATNPCFVGATRVATEKGLVPIEELVRETEPIFITTDARAPIAGRGKPSPFFGTLVRTALRVFYTGIKPVVRLKTREGFKLTLTPDHRLLTPEGYKEVAQLKPGDKLYVQSGEGVWAKEWALPQKVLQVARERVATAGNRSGNGRQDLKEKYANLPTSWSRELGVVLGWLVGDGYLRRDSVGFYFNEQDRENLDWLVDYLKDRFGGGSEQKTPSHTYHLHFKKLPAEYFDAFGLSPAAAGEKRVPEAIFRAPREAVIGFLQGLFSADGSVQINEKKKDATIRLASSSLGLLEDVQLLLLNLGVFSRIHKRRSAGTQNLPDGKGGSKAYRVRAQYELIIGSASRDRFAQTVGFLQPQKQVKLEAFLKDRSRGSYRQRFEVTVESIEAAGEAPVFDLTEPATHSLIAGGFVAHNCGEIPLTVGEPCDLGAMNLAAYVDEEGRFDMARFRQDVHTAVRFLDNVLEVNKFALEDNRQASQRLRRLGLGVMGLADALIKMGLAYDTQAARDRVYEIMSAMREEAVKASEALAEERGVFPLYREHEPYFQKLGIRPRRNVALLTVAPTGTTSMLMGVSSGIEPVFAPFVWRRIGGEYKALIHPLFKELLEKHPPHPDLSDGQGGWDWDKVTEAIQENHGSVQGLAFVPEELQKVFKCAHDVHPLDHVRMQGVVQRAFDEADYAGNSLSKTINLPREASVEDVEAAYTEAWRTGCKGITVYRDGSREHQVISTSKKDEGKESDEAKTKGGVPTRAFGKPVFERTGRLFGFTDMVKLTASDGTRYSYLVTVNMEGSHPIEVILTTGKAGDEQNADAEALGRVVSIALQYGVPPEAIIHTLRGINGGLYGSYHKKFVASKGDLIALALEQSLKIHNGDRHPLKQAVARVVQKPLEVEVGVVQGQVHHGRACPECGGPVKVEDGCLTCEVCGWSKCG